MSRRRELARLHQRVLAPPFGRHLRCHLPGDAGGGRGGRRGGAGLPDRDYWFWRAAILASFFHLLLWVDLEPISEHKHASDRCQGNTFRTPIALQLAAVWLGYRGDAARRRLSRGAVSPVRDYKGASKSPTLISSGRRPSRAGAVSLIAAWNRSGLTGRQIKSAGNRRRPSSCTPRSRLAVGRKFRGWGGGAMSPLSWRNAHFTAG